MRKAAQTYHINVKLENANRLIKALTATHLRFIMIKSNWISRLRLELDDSQTQIICE